MSRVTAFYLLCELCRQFKRICNSWIKVEGGWALFLRFQLVRAMGFRAVSDLSDYTVSELLELIEKASQVIRDKLTDRHSSAASVASSSSFSAVEPEPVAAPEPPVQRNSAGLRSPYECDYHCKFCQKQCCRPHPHKNHACIEHRKWR